MPKCECDDEFAPCGEHVEVDPANPCEDCAEVCQHPHVNVGMVQDSKDQMHIYVTELCIDCVQTRAIVYRRLNLGDWKTIDEFRDKFDGQLIGAPKEDEDA